MLSFIRKRQHDKFYGPHAIREGVVDDWELENICFLLHWNIGCGGVIIGWLHVRSNALYSIIFYVNVISNQISFSSSSPTILSHIKNVSILRIRIMIATYIHSMFSHQSYCKLCKTVHMSSHLPLEVEKKHCW